MSHHALVFIAARNLFRVLGSRLPAVEVGEMSFRKDDAIKRGVKLKDNRKRGIRQINRRAFSATHFHIDPHASFVTLNVQTANLRNRSRRGLPSLRNVCVRRRTE